MWQRESKACVSQACSTTNLWALGVECRKSSGCWSRPCEVQRRHVLRWNLPTPRFASAPPDVWICGGWGLLSCEWPDLLVPGGFVYQVRRRGLDTQPWVAPPECIRFFFVQQVWSIFGCPSGRKERGWNMLRTKLPLQSSLSWLQCWKPLPQTRSASVIHQCLDFEFNIVAGI